MFSLKSPKARLNARIQQYLEETAFVTDDALSDQMIQSLIEARSQLDSDQINDAHASLMRAKRSWTIARKEKSIRYYRSSHGMFYAMFLLVAFSAGLLAVVIYDGSIPEQLPPAILATLAGGVGGCVMVFLQVVDVDPQSEAVSKWPWYVIKPLLGASLGLITYFAVLTGVTVLTQGSTPNAQEGAIVIGFLAGFFETFSTGILGRIAGQYTAEKENESEQ